MDQISHPRRDPIEERLISIIRKLSEPELTAYEQYARLRTRIEKFAARLDGKSEILVMVAGFSHFQALRIYCEEPYTIVFVGETDHGGTAEVIQHVNQMGVKLSEVPCPSRRPKRRIEFGPPYGDQNE